MNPFTTPSIVAYGAAAEPEPPVSTWQRLRTHLKHAHHLARDRNGWKQNDLSALNYRNYQSVTSINRGDQAIVESILAKLYDAVGKVDIVRKNWGSLHTVARSSAMVAVCGSGYLALNQDNKVRASTLSDLQFLLSNDIPVALFGVGINQILSPDKDDHGEISAIDVPVVRSLLDRCNLISVRDWRTQRALQSLTSKPVHMVADPALYFAPLHPLAERRIASLDRPLHIGFNLPFHGPSANRRIQKDLHRYIALLKAMQGLGACEFFYLSHYGPEEVVAQMIQDAGIPMTLATGTPDELVKTYKNLDIHVGGMLHSCILATSCAVPCIGLAYDVKHEGFFDVMGMPEQCVSAVNFDVQQTLAVFQQMRPRLPALQQKIVKRRQALEQEFDSFLQRAVQHIGIAKAVAHA